MACEAADTNKNHFRAKRYGTLVSCGVKRQRRLMGLGLYVNRHFDNMEPALYFSIVTFSTLGYGDIVLDPQWRILGSLTAANGLIIVGLNTAVLVEAIARIRAAQYGIAHE